MVHGGVYGGPDWTPWNGTSTLVWTCVELTNLRSDQITTNNLADNVYYLHILWNLQCDAFWLVWSHEILLCRRLDYYDSLARLIKLYAQCNFLLHGFFAQAPRTTKEHILTTTQIKMLMMSSWFRVVWFFRSESLSSKRDHHLDS